jgi:N-methylhydantoinase A
VTDAALVLGYLGPDTELGDGLALDAGAAEAVMADLAEEAGLEGPVAAARGVYRVANATMARTIREVTVERGHDPRRFAMVAFGGAGPMHAAALADRLDVETVLVPRANGVLSALGLLAADERHDAVRTLGGRLDAVDPETVESRYDDLRERVLAETSDPEAAALTRGADLRYAGQSHELTVDVAAFDPPDVAEAFHAAHERARGYRLDEPVELVTLRVTATIPGDEPDVAHEGGDSEPRTSRPVRADDGPHETPVYDREAVAAGLAVDGPAVFEGAESTVVVPPDWRAGVDERGTLRLERAEGEA